MPERRAVKWARRPAADGALTSLRSVDRSVLTSATAEFHNPRSPKEIQSWGRCGKVRFQPWENDRQVVPLQRFTGFSTAVDNPVKRRNFLLRSTLAPHPAISQFQVRFRMVDNR
jgi:hypothetical protein